MSNFTTRVVWYSGNTITNRPSSQFRITGINQNNDPVTIQTTSGPLQISQGGNTNTATWGQLYWDPPPVVEKKEDPSVDGYNLKPAGSRV